MNQPTDPARSDTDTSPARPSKDRPVLQDAPPAKPGHEVVVASDSGKPWVVGLVAGVMLIIGLVIGSLLWTAPDMRPYVEPFLESVSHEQYAQAYSQVGKEWRGIMPEKDFVIMHKIIHHRLGEFISLKQVSLEKKTHPVLGNIDIAHFDARFKNGDVDLSAILRETSQGWSLLNVQYITPLLEVKPATQPAGHPATRALPSGQATHPAVPLAVPLKAPSTAPSSGQ